MLMSSDVVPTGTGAVFVGPDAPSLRSQRYCTVPAGWPMLKLSRAVNDRASAVVEHPSEYSAEALTAVTRSVLLTVVVVVGATVVVGREEEAEGAPVVGGNELAVGAAVVLSAGEAVDELDGPATTVVVVVDSSFDGAPESASLHEERTSITPPAKTIAALPSPRRVLTGPLPLFRFTAAHPTKSALSSAGPPHCPAVVLATVLLATAATRSVR